MLIQRIISISAYSIRVHIKSQKEDILVYFCEYVLSRLKKQRKRRISEILEILGDIYWCVNE